MYSEKGIAQYTVVVVIIPTYLVVISSPNMRVGAQRFPKGVSFLPHKKFSHSNLSIFHCSSRVIPPPVGSGRVGSGQELFEIQRVGLGRVGSGWVRVGTSRFGPGKPFQISRVGPGHLDPIRPARSDPNRYKPWYLEKKNVLPVLLQAEARNSHFRPRSTSYARQR